MTVTDACEHDRHDNCPQPDTCPCGCHVFVRLGLRTAWQESAATAA